VKKALVLALLPFALFAFGRQILRPHSALVPAPATARTWEPLGPYGGNVRALAANPADPNELFAVAQTGQIFRSADGGGLWTLLAVRGTALYDVAFAPSRPDMVHIVTSGGLLVSTNHGAQWSERPFPAGGSSVANIWIDPADPDRVVVGGSYWTPSSGCAALFKSTDGGLTWTTKTFSCASTGTCYRIAVDSSDPDVVYAGASFYVLTGGPSYSNFYKTTDGGTTWQIVSGGSAPIAIAVDPRNPLRVFASGGSGAGGGMMRSLDGGQTWTRTSDATGQSIVFDPVRPETVYAGFGSTFYRTDDGGESWTRATHVSDGFCTSIIPLAGKLLYGSTSGVSASADGGTTWTAADDGMNGRDVPAFGVAPTVPGTVYAVAEYYPQSSYTQGLIHKTIDGGSTWTELSIWLSYDPASSRMAVDPFRADRVWARDRELWRSEDGGATWAGLPARSTIDDLGDLAVSDLTSGYIAAAGSGTRYPGAVPYMSCETSFDGGDNWTVLPVNLERGSGSAVAFDPRDGNSIFVGGEVGGRGALFRSRDGGSNWTEIDAGVFGTDPVAVVAVDPEDGGKLYAGTAGGFFATEDGGTTWAKTASFAVSAVAIPRSDPRQVIAAGPSGISWSGDRGRTWASLAADLHSARVNAMQLLADGSALYAGTPNGLYRRTLSLPGRIHPLLAFSATKFVNRSLSQAETIHRLRWSPNPKNADITSTRVYSAQGTTLGRLLGQVPASLGEWTVRAAPSAGATYAALAVDKTGREGEPAFVSVK
jgi:photosystem II stability/assembly factor-like uncharacterized protein